MTRQHVVLARGGLAAAASVAVALCAATIGAVPVAAATSHAVTSTRSGTSRSAAGEAIDRRIARQAGLQRFDFPAGWTSSPAPAQTMGSGCPGVTAAKAAVSAQARSREFMLGGSATADSAIYVYPDVATSVHSFGELTSHRTTACLVRVLRDSLGFQLAAEGATLDSLTSHVLTIGPVGDQHSAHLLTVRLSAGATKATAYADVIFVRVGRAVAAFSLGSIGQRFDPALEAKLTNDVAARLPSSAGQGS